MGNLVSVTPFRLSHHAAPATRHTAGVEAAKQGRCGNHPGALLLGPSKIFGRDVLRSTCPFCLGEQFLQIYLCFVAVFFLAILVDYFTGNISFTATKVIGLVTVLLPITACFILRIDVTSSSESFPLLHPQPRTPPSSPPPQAPSSPNRPSIRSIKRLLGSSSSIIGKTNTSNLGTSTSSTAVKASDFNNFTNFDPSGNTAEVSVEQTVSALKEASSEKDAKDNLEVLIEITRNAATWVKVFDAKGIESVIKAMDMYDTYSSVQKKGVSLLNLLATNSDCRTAILQGGGIERILAIIEGYKDDTDVQEISLAALSNLAVDVDGHKLMAETVDGIIQSVVEILRKEKDVWIEAQKHCCEVLYFLAKTPPNAKRIKEVKGIDAVISLMERLENDLHVQRRGCGALWTISRDKENAELIVKKGGTSIILNAMTNHGCVVKRNGCGALANLSMIEDNRPLIVQATNSGSKKSIDVVLKAMKDHEALPGLQLFGCAVLGNVGSVLESSDKISESIERISDVMSKHALMVGVQVEACTAIKKLADQLKRAPVGNSAAGKPMAWVNPRYVKKACGKAAKAVEKAKANHRSQKLRECAESAKNALSAAMKS